MRRIVLLLVLVAPFADAPTAGAARWRPPQRLTWYWQLAGRVRNSVSAAVYDIDGFDGTAAEVRGLHKLGRHTICYIDAGSWESWRPDARRFPAGVLGRGNGWPGERWVDIRRRSILGPIMRARLEMCAHKRFDAIEPDNIDGFENPTGFRITAREQRVYNEWLAREAHGLGLAVFQKNDPSQARELERSFDGALSEQCNQYNECSSFTAYLKAGKPVLDAEYDRSLYPRICAADTRMGVMGVLFNLALDGAVYKPCWTTGASRSSR